MIIFILGSPSDSDHLKGAKYQADEFGIPNRTFYASAHKSPQLLLEFLETTEAIETPKVYITIAGLSNALSGMVDANVTAPVIACPAIDKESPFAPFDLFSTLRMPRGVAPATILQPENAVILAAKILGYYKQVVAFQESQKQSLKEANQCVESSV